MKFKIQSRVEGWNINFVGESGLAEQDIVCSVYLEDKNGWCTEPIYRKKITSNKNYEDEKDFEIKTINEFSAKLRKLLN
jgi:hypothetical protein